MSPRDPPLWARGVAAGLLLFASWWLLDTDSMRDTIGDSVGALCLGVIAASILQGMRLPLGIWPEGPWRKRFAIPAVVGTALVVAALLLVSRVAPIDALVSQVELGTGISVVVGAVALGFVVAFVRQRRYLAWYGIAVLLGITPFASELLLGTTRVGINVLPSLAFLTAIGTTSKLVTEELAFRRLLIGVAAGAGLLSVLVSSIAGLGWFFLLSRLGVGNGELVIMGTLGAVSAGCVFVLSKSLVASALFSAVFFAGHMSLTFASTTVGTPAEALRTPATWIAAFIVSAVLAGVVVRRNGFFGNLKETVQTDVTSH